MWLKQKLRNFLCLTFHFQPFSSLPNPFWLITIYNHDNKRPHLANLTKWIQKLSTEPWEINDSIKQIVIAWRSRREKRNFSLKNHSVLRKILHVLESDPPQLEKWIDPENNMWKSDSYEGQIVDFPFQMTIYFSVFLNSRSWEFPEKFVEFQFEVMQ